MTVLIEQYVEHYQIGPLLNSGSIGDVYEAYNVRSDERVVLKMMHAHLAQDGAVSAQFHAAARANLDHPNIVPISDWGIYQNRPYIVMPYIEARNLAVYLQELAYHNEHMPLADVLTIGIQIAEALAYAHEQKQLIHRDIKPANILVPLPADQANSGYIEQLLLTDFDLAIPPNTLPPGDSAGSQPYMAPEQQQGRAADGRSDIYALGVILYQLTTGQLPYADGITPDMPPPPPHYLNDQLPEPLAHIIMKAMALAPLERYLNSQALADDLKEQQKKLANLLMPTQDGIWMGDTQLEVEETGAAAQARRLTIAALSDDRLTIYQSSPIHYDLGQDLITIGRADHMDLVLPDKTISRRHATLQREDSQWIIRNLNSRNGVFLDETRLLANAPEVWYPHQTLRIGPYSIQLKTTGGGSINEQPQAFNALITPNQIEMQPGDTPIAIQLVVINQTETEQLYQIQLEADFDWYTLPTDALGLSAKEKRIIPISFHPPANSTVQANTYNYTILIQSMYGHIQTIRLRGTVTINTFVSYETNLTPNTLLHWLNVCQVEIENQGNETKTFSIQTTSTYPTLKFGLPEEQMKVRQKEGRSNYRGRFQAIRQVPMVGTLLIGLRQLSPLRFIRNYAYRFNRYTRYLTQIQRIFGVKPTTAPQTGSLLQRKDALNYSRSHYTFFDNIDEPLEIEAGRQKAMAIMVQPKKRPLIGVPEQHPFTVTVSTTDSTPRVLNGQLTVRPRLTTRWFYRFILIFLILSMILFLWYASGRLKNPIVVPFQSFDVDKDGLYNAAEVHFHGTDPNSADTDQDGLKDKYEVERNWEPLVADMDQDGLLDGEESRRGTDPLNRDSDGDGLSDGEEVLRNTNPLSVDSDGNKQADPCDTEATTVNCPTDASATTPRPGDIVITSSPTATPLPSPTSDPIDFDVVTNSILASDPRYDGYLRYKAGAPIILNSSGETIIIGDSGTENEQYMGIISFDTSIIPANAQIQSVQLQLTQQAIQQNPFDTLGNLEVIIAPANGFSNNVILEEADFSAPAATIAQAQRLNITTADINNNTINLILDQTYYRNINRQGNTQFRLRFELLSNDDDQANQIIIYSGDSSANNAPQLLITYQLLPQ